MRIHNSKRKEGHEQHYSELVLFSHWRNETEEFYEDSVDECVEVYNLRKNEIIVNREKIYPGEDTIELFEIGDLEMRKPEHVADILDCQGEQDNEDDIATGCDDDPQYEISMVGAGMLYRIHLRLCTLFNTDEFLPFANVNVMLVGDSCLQFWVFMSLEHPKMNLLKQLTMDLTNLYGRHFSL